MLQTQETKKSVLRIVIPVVVLVVVVAGAGYLFFTGIKFKASEESITIKPAVTEAEVEKPKQVEPVKEPEAAKERTVVQQPVSSETEEGEYYTVQVKDELKGIGKKIYGNDKDWKKIYDQNKEKIGDPNLIYPGQKFIIPR